MTAVARQRAASRHGDREFVTAGDIRDVRLGTTFDAVMMFAVLGYQHTNAEVLDALATARAHLTWEGCSRSTSGTALRSSERPSERVKVVATADGELERRASASLQPDAHLCTVSYRLISRRPGMPDEATDEVHRMRYFFRETWSASSTRPGSRSATSRRFQTRQRPSSSAAWNVLATASG